MTVSTSSFLRYSTVGGIATGLHYAVLFILVEVFHFRPAYSAAIGAGCGAVVAYYLNVQFTFKYASINWPTLCRFLIIAAIGAAFSAFLVWVTTSVLLLHYIVGQIAATFVILMVTYFANAFWTFR